MKYYIIVASKDHVEKGVAGGFAQAGHGKRRQLDKLEKGDWVIYYSSKDQYKDGKTYQKFTAIGQVVDEVPYQVVLPAGLEPWRRNIEFHSGKEIEIRPLLNDLEFITNRNRWGLHLMSGFIGIGQGDFQLIAEKMISEFRN